MNELNSKKRVTKTMLCIIISLSAFLITAILLLIVFMQPKSSYVSSDDKTESITVLHCQNNSPSEPFFTWNTELSARHEIKVTFDNKIANNYNYTYTGEYISDEDAKEALSWLHADYNEYMGETNIHQEKLTPTFSAIESNVIINLYIDNKYFTPTTAKFVFMNDSEYIQAQDLSAIDMEKIYEDKGFSCELSK